MLPSARRRAELREPQVGRARIVARGNRAAGPQLDGAGAFEPIDRRFAPGFAARLAPGNPGDVGIGLHYEHRPERRERPPKDQVEGDIEPDTVAVELREPEIGGAAARELELEAQR